MKPYSGVKVQTKDSGMFLISITRSVLLRQRAADVSKVCSDPDMVRQVIFRSKQEIISHTRKRSTRAFRRLPILEIADTEFFLNPPTAYFCFITTEAPRIQAPLSHPHSNTHRTTYSPNTSTRLQNRSLTPNHTLIANPYRSWDCPMHPTVNNTYWL